MEFNHCVQCGTEIDSKGIQFRGQTFCGDECCEEFEAEFAVTGEPGAADLVNEALADAEIDDDLDEENLGYREDDPSDRERPNDDFDIESGDF
jgi:hypothetical protein